jgi:hypothetical protein
MNDAATTRILEWLPDYDAAAVGIRKERIGWNTLILDAARAARAASSLRRGTGRDGNHFGVVPTWHCPRADLDRAATWPHAHAWQRALGALAAALFVSWWIYVLIEKPCAAIRRKLRHQYAIVCPGTELVTGQAGYPCYPANEKVVEP